jgi:hypothetical protein
VKRDSKEIFSEQIDPLNCGEGEQREERAYPARTEGRIG